MSVQHNAHVPIEKNGGAASHTAEDSHKPAENGQQQPMEVDSEPLPGPLTSPPTTTFPTFPTEKKSKFTPAGLRMLEAIWGFESLSGCYTRIVGVHPSVLPAPPPPPTLLHFPLLVPRENTQRPFLRSANEEV
jgi:hypothetical protein